MQSRSEGQLPATPGMPLTWVQETAGPFFRPGPSMAFNHDRLIDSRGDSVGQLNATQRGGAITAHEQPKVTVLSIAAISEVLALHYLLHNVIRINASIIHPGRVALH